VAIQRSLADPRSRVDGWRYVCTAPCVFNVEPGRYDLSIDGRRMTTFATPLVVGPHGARVQLRRTNAGAASAGQILAIVGGVVAALSVPPLVWASGLDSAGALLWGSMIAGEVGLAALVAGVVMLNDNVAGIARVDALRATVGSVATRF
jgi:hypothetical protein